MIVISTESNYLIGDVSLPWMQEVDVPSETAAVLLTYPGIVAKNPTLTELLSVDPVSTRSKSTTTTKE